MEQSLRDAARHLDVKGVLGREKYQDYYETRRGQVPHSYTIIRRYNRWNLALKAAGLPVHNRSPYATKISDNDCIRALLYARDELGHLPSVGEYTTLWNDQNLQNKYPSPSTIRARFGKWRLANAEAANWIDRRDELEAS